MVSKVSLKKNSLTNMSKRKVIAIAYSDQHVHGWKSYSVNDSRLMLSCEILHQVGLKAKKYNVPILFAGDLIHNPLYIENRVLKYLVGSYKRAIGSTNFYAISGNHDLDGRNTMDIQANSHLEFMDLVFPNFWLLDRMGVVQHGDMLIAGIPYFNGNQGFTERLKFLETKIKDNPLKKILLVHTDLHGAVNGSERSIEDVQNIPKDMDSFFSKWDLVLSGHIHIPQRLGKNIYMLGAPYQQNWGESNVEMGYWKIYDKGEPKFIYLRNPEFIKLKPNEKVPDDDNIYEHEVEEKVDGHVFDVAKFSKVTSRSKLAKRYSKTKGITDKNYIGELIDILNQV